jgi:hypothetical protein
MTWWPLFPSPLTAFDYALIAIAVVVGLNALLRFFAAAGAHPLRMRESANQVVESEQARLGEQPANPPRRRKKTPRP